MRQTRVFRNARFSSDVLQFATSLIYDIAVPHANRAAGDARDFLVSGHVVRSDGAVLEYAEIDQFLTAYRAPVRTARFAMTRMSIGLTMDAGPDDTSVRVNAMTEDHLAQVFGIFDAAYLVSKIPPVIFIGHGRDPAWISLRDHLQNLGFQTTCFEAESRAGEQVTSVLEQMLAASRFAVLVATGEDLQPGGEMRARQNVVHEIGLFQARLGNSRAIALLEEGTEQFSNNAGVQHIPFPKGNIATVFDQVLSVIKREFG